VGIDQSDRGMIDGISEDIDQTPRLGSVATALWSQAESRRVAAELSDAGVPALMLKGPDLQQRLYGTPAAYASGDVDVLIPRRLAARARDVLARQGWRFEPENGVLWRLSAAATYAREGFRLDLHWGVHAAHLPAWTLRRLEDRLWSGARVAASGFLEPDPPSLLVYLAVHAEGHRYAREVWGENVGAAAALIHDWHDVKLIARHCRVEGAVLRALRGQVSDDTPILDGSLGAVLWYATWVSRGHFLPQRVRDAVRDNVGLLRQGYGLIGLRGVSTKPFAGRMFVVIPGVFAPRSVTYRVVREARARLSDISSPIVAEVGTGTGAVAVTLSLELPAARVIAMDVSARAVRCARKNAKRLGASNIEFRQGHLLQRTPDDVVGSVDAILTNVPYVNPANAAAADWREPLSTIEGPQADGLGLMRELARHARDVLKPGGWLVFQIADWQWETFAPDLGSLGYDVIAPAERRPGYAIVGCARWGSSGA
jgi:methylase of polypeptide subunit release factors